LADALHRLHRRRALRAHRHLMLLRHLVQWWEEDAEHDDKSHPGQDDQRRELMHRARENRHVRQPCGPVVGHADFTMQKVCARTPSADLSSLTTSLTMMRQPIWSLSPCATTLTLTEGSVV